MTAVEFILLALPQFCFGYPFVMAWYWMAGGLLYYFVHERSSAAGYRSAADRPLAADLDPRALLQRERQRRGDAARRRRRRLSRLRGHRHQRRQPRQHRRGAGSPGRRRSRACASSISRRTSGKATALNTGALLARHEILVCIDGDALLDPQALRWIARVFTASGVGAVTGNPRIRNRTSLLGRLQVGEFSSIIGLIRRAQTVYGRLFTVSGVLCAFRKRALEEAGWWSPRTITDDIDVTWRVQLAGWRVDLRAQRHRLDPDARDAARPVEAAPALGRGRRADDDRLLPADDPRPRAEPAADLPELRAEPRVGLLHAVRADRRHPVGRGRAAARDPAGLRPRARMVGAHAHPHLSRAGAGQPPRRAPLRARHAARRCSGSSGIRSPSGCSARSPPWRPCRARCCGRAARPGTARTGGCDEQAAAGDAGRR